MTQLEDRKVYTRADLIASRGIGLSTLQLLYRQRAQNGHPESAGKIGRSLVWDAQEWDAWYDRYRSATSPASTAQPASTARPVSAGPGGRVPGVDYSGNPEDLLTLAEAGRVLGLAPNSVTVYVSRPPDGWPSPDESEVLPGGKVRRRRYRRRRIWEYAAHRQRHPGGGRPAGSSSGARAYPYDGDPRLELARAALQSTPAHDHARLPVTLAAQHGSTPGTWAGVLAIARQHPTSQATDIQE